MTNHPFLRALFCLALLPAAALAWEKDSPPVPPVISPELELEYREAALLVMKKHEVQINDLYALLKPRRAEFQKDDDVHFSAAGTALMATQVADAIAKAITAQGDKK